LRERLEPKFTSVVSQGEGVAKVRLPA
jgi:hypothetical protein